MSVSLIPSFCPTFMQICNSLHTRISPFSGCPGRDISFTVARVVQLGHPDGLEPTTGDGPGPARHGHGRRTRGIWTLISLGLCFGLCSSEAEEFVRSDVLDEMGQKG